MNAVINWTYEKRDPISYTGALFMCAFVLLLINFAPSPSLVPDENEMSAYLNTPAPPPPKVDPVQKVQPQPIIKQEPLKLPTSKTPSPVDIPESPKTQEVKAQPPIQQPIVQAPSPTPIPVQAPPIVAPAPKLQTVSLDASYVSELKAYLEKIKKYPSSREARLSRPQGTVTLSLLITRSGQLLEVRVLTTSHSNILDSEAVKSIKTASLPAFPKEAFMGEDSHEFSVNMNYTLTEQ
jgi:protein TonB